MINSALRRLFYYIPLSEKQKWDFKCFTFTHFAFIFKRTSFYKKWEIVQRVAQEHKLVDKDELKRRYTPHPIDLTATFAFNSEPSPEVSIIIPVYNNIGYTHRCLQSIHALKTKHTFEIIVVDDCSTDDTDQVLARISGIKVIRNESNQGFIRSCNRGAAEAAGKYVLFLNNDTQVLAGWLDELVGTFSIVPEAGLVGSKLIYPDGCLQEAGGIIWSDATGYNFGRLGNPGAPQYNYLREVDYCSGASILVPTELFKAVGMFDVRYVPAYCEDADLAFSIRKAGWKVLYQPLSEVIHFEGVTSGTDTNTGIKAYQVINQQKFAQKWHDVLLHHQQPGVNIDHAKERAVSRRILVVDALPPTPDQDAGSVTAFYQYRALVDLGFKLTFVAAHNLNHFGRYTEDLQRFGVECVYAPYLQNASRFIKERGHEFDVVMLSRISIAAALIDDVKKYCLRARIIFNTVDLHYLREDRQAALEGSAEMAAQAAITRKKELGMIRKADASIVVSDVEKELLAIEAPNAKVHLIPLLMDIPGIGNDFENRNGIVFVGGYQHTPNIDAVYYFVQECWPLIRQQQPDMHLSIIGSNPPPEFSTLAGNGVEIVGFVEDLAPYFNAARLSIAPLRYGAGIKGKVGVSLSYGLPCVASEIAAEGMGLIDGAEVMVAKNPDDFAKKVIDVYNNEDLWMQLSKNGLEFVRRHYSLEAGRAKLRALLDDLGTLSSSAENRVSYESLSNRSAT